MSPSDCLSQFVTERLTAAAEEIFVVFQQTIAEYEKEIERQRRLLDVAWKPELKLRRIEIPQQRVFKEEEEEEEGLADQQFCNQERNSSLDQEDPEPPQIKEEPEDLCKTPTPISEERDHSEPEPKVQHQLLSDSSHAAVSQEQREGKHGDWRSTQNAEPNLTETHHTSQSHSDNNYNSNSLEVYLEGKESFNCGTCGKAFQYYCQLNAHLRSHTGEKPYLCKTCGKRFRQNSALNTHLRIHTGEKLHTCATCGRDFRFRSILSAHMRRHTGEKPYLCNTCGQRFSEMQTLKRHTRIHTGEKPYTCTTCGKDFRSSSGLSEHKRRHTGEKPHTCATCGKNFVASGSLKRHRRTHTGEKTIPLQDLWEKFPSESIIGHLYTNPHGQEAITSQDLL